ncbi:MAG TPA: helix-turn-helix domain-containing protein [Actinomycetota bacterium]|nr:helix-turn-helix domain-containing protein [Actinomycetota bacterium]
MDAATKLFIRRGTSDTTIADIAEAAHVAKGTFYLYFDSKEQLLAALKERWVDEMMAHALPFIERIGKEDWWGLADAVAESMVDFTLVHADLCAFVMQQPHTPGTKDILAECERRVNAMIAGGLQVGIDSGAFHVEDPELAAIFLKNGTIFTVMEAILYGGKPDRARLVAMAKHLNRKMLAP